MTISNTMNFCIHTLIDITETNTRRQDDDKFAYKQQANFQSVLQTIGLRVNLYYDNSPSFDDISLEDFAFGDKYLGKQKVWTFEFGIEYEGGLDTDMLKKDFDLIPIITGLNESIQLDKALFRTTGKETNIIFSVVDQGT
jgi:hypothetical protein